MSADERFTAGLIADVFAVLDSHGYVRGGNTAAGAAVGALVGLAADYEGFGTAVAPGGADHVEADLDMIAARDAAEAAAEPASVRDAYDPDRTPGAAAAEADQPSGGEYRQALDAVLDAIDLPFGATEGDDDRRSKVLARRAITACVNLRAFLDETDPRYRAVTLAHLRDRLGEHAPDYRTAGGGESP